MSGKEGNEDRIGGGCSHQADLTENGLPPGEETHDRGAGR